MPIDYSLYLIADRQYTKNINIIEAVEASIKAGVTCVQLREKRLNKEEILLLGKKLLNILRPLNIPLIINDYVDIAYDLNADGVHLGQLDIAHSKAREILGRGKIIGLSVENYQQAVQYADVDVDYFGVGPVFATQSKSDAADPIGINELKKIRQVIKKPMIAIGGINHSNIAQVMQCQVDGVAVISAILASDNPAMSTRQMKQLIEKFKKSHVNL